MHVDSSQHILGGALPSALELRALQRQVEVVADIARHYHVREPTLWCYCRPRTHRLCYTRRVR